MSDDDLEESMNSHAWDAFQPYNLPGPHSSYAWAVYVEQHKMAWEWFCGNSK
jgi:hypothetical protein